ncbi:MAG: DUF3459 domain-containing protein, partial [Rhodobacteraceae bacterium]|nr:DUF3459 domain-containing protein [Paracoccaceae bacterium]
HLAKFSIALLAALRGSLCIYQGEELGLPESDVAFEDLTDPYGIRFWPAYKGRDGCRTPMVWEADAPNGGFTTGTPWLPISNADLAVDQGGPVLDAYRKMLAFRADHPAIQQGSISFLPEAGEVLAFTRETEEETLLFVFNLGRKATSWPLPEGMAAGANLIPEFSASADNTEVNLTGLDAYCARLK